MKNKRHNNWFTQIFFPEPNSCLLCNTRLVEQEQYICAQCFSQIFRVHPPLCENCGRPIGALSNCLQCRGREYAFDNVISWGIYRGKLREIVHLFKFKRYSYLGYVLINKMFAEMNSLKQLNNYIIVPVPLYSSRIMKRGYNQAQVLSEALAMHTGFPVRPALERNKYLHPQAGHKLPERQQAVKEHFAVKEGYAQGLVGKRVLLIDDVITTGSTVDECSRVLRLCGVAHITILTVGTTLLK